MARLAVRRLAPLPLLVCLLSAPLEAQQTPHGPAAHNRSAPKDFGSDTQNLLISYLELVPTITSGVETSADAGIGLKWIRSTSPTNPPLVAAINGRIPNGSRITQICAYGRDNDAAVGQDVHVNLRRNHVTVAGEDPGLLSTLTISSSGAPGDYQQCSNVDILVDNRYDIDGDGAIELIDYSVNVFFGGTPVPAGAALAIRLVRIDWHRQVSPAPTSATFTDVPVGHPYHRFVEALADAGITSGCGGGLYCVNNPITRGEMAVFLAAALGLHWPAF